MSAAPWVNPYHCEVIGSLLRPEPLKKAMDRAEQDELSPEELADAQDEAALQAIALQEECGIEVITDGEVRRWYWFDPLTESLDGYSREATAPVPFSSAEGEKPSLEVLKLPAVNGRLGLA